jgi:hypothetical protein
MDIQEIRAIVRCCEFLNYEFEVCVDGRGATYLQGVYNEPDVKTGKNELQRTRRWFLSPEMCKSEIIQTVFKCALTSMEHRTREWFRYRERAIFGPHFDVDSLHAICTDQHLDFRGKTVAAGAR